MTTALATTGTFQGTLSEFLDFKVGFICTPADIENFTKETQAILEQIVDDPRISDASKALMPQLREDKQCQWWRELPLWIDSLPMQERVVVSNAIVTWS